MTKRRLPVTPDEDRKQRGLSLSPRLAGPLVCTLSHCSHVRLSVTLWTVARQAPLSMGFSRQEYWSGLPCPSPGDLPQPGIEPVSHLLHWQAATLPLVPPGKPLLGH